MLLLNQTRGEEGEGNPRTPGEHLSPGQRQPVSRSIQLPALLPWGYPGISFLLLQAALLEISVTGLVSRGEKCRSLLGHTLQAREHTPRYLGYDSN